MYICIFVAHTMKQFIGAHIDFFGFLNSFLCAIHCAIFPLLISLGLLESLFWIEHFWLEMTFLFLSIFFASLSLIKSFKVHRRLEALFMVLLGLSCLFVGLNLEHGIFQTTMMTLGGVIIASAHIVNYFFNKSSLKA